MIFNDIILISQIKVKYMNPLKFLYIFVKYKHITVLIIVKSQSYLTKIGQIAKNYFRDLEITKR